jgi:hypothetical protein
MDVSDINKKDFIREPRRSIGNAGMNVINSYHGNESMPDLRSNRKRST